jgi:DNA-binding transcriptional ArsR family regulator
METKRIIAALEALAQESRLGVFRALVQTGPQGLTPSQLSQRFDLPAPTLSFHLAQLRHAGLITVKREGRSLIYAADYAAMRGVVDFLTENCCAGEACAPKPKEKTHETPARARRRA